MTKVANTTLLLVFATLMSSQAEAGVVFTFNEVGGDVVMQSSGVLNTEDLVSVNATGWGSAGTENNAAPQSDIMGDTTLGSLDTAYAFNAGTDLSPWIGNMFTASNFSWTSTGTTPFATYYLNDTTQLGTPGIAIRASDLVGNLWTPDVSWSQVGTFASLGLTQGTYTITDAVTKEFITIQIGAVSAVPEPGCLALFGIGLVGFIAARNRRES